MLHRLLSLVFVTLGLTAPMGSVAAQPFTQGAAASAISAANALSARIRSYRRWQGLTPPPASYCATMREGEAVLKQLSRLASRAILYRAPGLALSLQEAGDRLSDELDEEEETNQQAGMPYTLYPCPVPAPYPPRALVLMRLHTTTIAGRSGGRTDHGLTRPSARVSLALPCPLRLCGGWDRQR